jgi:large subunit ribosomal protein L7e
MAAAAAEAKPAFVPESTLKKRKREEQWDKEAKEKALADRKKARESRTLIFARAKQYAEEYDAKVSRIPVPISCFR